MINFHNFVVSVLNSTGAQVHLRMIMKLKTRLDYQIDDEFCRFLCQCYWYLDEWLNFIIETEEICQAFTEKSGKSLSTHHMGVRIKEWCSFYIDDVACPICGNIFTHHVASRSSFRTDKRILNSGQGLLCKKCRSGEQPGEQPIEFRGMTDFVEKISKAQIPTFYKPLMQPIKERVAFQRNAESVLEGNKPFTYIHTVYFEALADTLLPIRENNTQYTYYRKGPVSEALSLLSPTKQFDNEILQELVSTGFINPRVGFEFDSNDDLRNIEWSPVWNRPEIQTPFDRESGLLEVWRRISIELCYQYYYFALEQERDFFVYKSINQDRLNSVFLDLLTQFSVAQVYRLIWSAVRNASDFSRRPGVADRHAINTIPGYMERYVQKAKQNGWVIEPFDRPSQCPISALEMVIVYSVCPFPISWDALFRTEPAFIYSYKDIQYDK